MAPVLVHRFGKWERVPGHALVPGDIVSICRATDPATGAALDVAVPADLLLLAGTCIANEAVLTGESTPQWKSPIEGAEPITWKRFESQSQSQSLSRSQCQSLKLKQSETETETETI